jgi:hypothetical protein
VKSTHSQCPGKGRNRHDFTTGRCAYCEMTLPEYKEKARIAKAQRDRDRRKKTNQIKTT